MTLSWSRVRYVENYEVQRWNQGAGSWDASVHNAPANVYTDSTVQSGVEYRYRVRAYTGSGAGRVNGLWGHTGEAGAAPPAPTAQNHPSNCGAGGVCRPVVSNWHGSGRLQLYLSQVMDTSVLPDPGDFTVTVEGVRQPVTLLAWEDSRRLRIDADYVNRLLQEVLVSYSPGDNPMRSDRGAAAAPFRNAKTHSNNGVEVRFERANYVFNEGDGYVELGVEVLKPQGSVFPGMVGRDFELKVTMCPREGVEQDPNADCAADTATDGRDFRGVPRTITVPAFNDVHRFRIRILEDNLLERETEEISISILPSEGLSPAFRVNDHTTVRIRDNESATVSFARTALTVREGRQATVAIVSDTPIAEDYGVNFQGVNGTAQDADWRLAEHSADGAFDFIVDFDQYPRQRKTFTFRALSDTVTEAGGETVTLKLGETILHDHRITLGPDLTVTIVD